MSKKTNLRFVRKVAGRFCQLRNLHHLAGLLQTEIHRLQLMAVQPQYHLFSIPKKDGSQRWIEDPADRLQDVQEKLNFFLGAVYYLRRSAAAYGFMLVVKNDPEPRNIVTNARRHLDASWLLNADLKDFFHQVKAERIFQLFTAPPFEFNHELADLLTRLTTNQGRLPMGAPTSPVLSNFATIKLDKQLQQLAEWAGWTYTRYADDMSFSGQQAFTDADMAKIRELVP